MPFVMPESTASDQQLTAKGFPIDPNSVLAMMSGGKSGPQPLPDTPEAPMNPASGYGDLLSGLVGSTGSTPTVPAPVDAGNAPAYTPVASLYNGDMTRVPGYQALQPQIDNVQSVYNTFQDNLANATSQQQQIAQGLQGTHIAAPNVSPVSPQEAGIATVLSLLGAAGGVRSQFLNAGLGSYLGGRQSAVQRDQSTRMAQYQAVMSNLQAQNQIANQAANNASMGLYHTGSNLANLTGKQNLAGQGGLTADTNQMKVAEAANKLSMDNETKRYGIDTNSDTRLKTNAATNASRLAIGKLNSDSRKYASDTLYDVTGLRMDQSDTNNLRNNDTRIKVGAANNAASLQRAQILADTAAKALQQKGWDTQSINNIRLALGLGAQYDNQANEWDKHYDAINSRLDSLLAVPNPDANVTAKIQWYQQILGGFQSQVGTDKDPHVLAAQAQKHLGDMLKSGPGTAPNDPETNVAPLNPMNGGTLSPVGGAGQLSGPFRGGEDPFQGAQAQVIGKVSWFGGKEDVASGQDNGKSAFGAKYNNGHIPTDQGNWVAVRPETARQLGIKPGDTVLLRNNRTGKITKGIYADSGPSKKTGRVVDMARGLLKATGGTTDDHYTVTKGT